MADDALSKGQRARQAILVAANDLFLAQGFHGTSMRQIAERSGMALGSIYNHFSGKEDIFNRLFLEKHPYHQVLSSLQQTPGDTIEEFVRNAAHIMVDKLVSEPGFLKLLFIEIVEFSGKHLPDMVVEIYPQALPLFDRFASPKGNLNEIPLPLLFRSFIGMFFSFALTDIIAQKVDLVGFKKGSLDQMIDLYLYGIVRRKEAE